MRTMKARLNNAMRQWYVRPWDVRIVGTRDKNFKRIEPMSDERWEKLSMQWDPAGSNGTNRRPDTPTFRHPAGSNGR